MFLSETTFFCVLSWVSFVRIPQRTDISAILIMHFAHLIVETSTEEQHFMRYWVDCGFANI